MSQSATGDGDAVVANGAANPGAASAPDIPQPPPAPKSIFDVIQETNDVDVPRQRISEDIRGIITKSGLEIDYNFIFLYDEYSQIGRFTSNRIYSAVTGGSHDPAK